MSNLGSNVTLITLNSEGIFASVKKNILFRTN